MPIKVCLNTENHISSITNEASFGTLLHVAGDFYIAAFLPVHYPEEELLVCNTDTWRERMLQASEAIVFAVNTFNEKYQVSPTVMKLLRIFISRKCYIVPK